MARPNIDKPTINAILTIEKKDEFKIHQEPLWHNRENSRKFLLAPTPILLFGSKFYLPSPLLLNPISSCIGLKVHDGVLKLTKIPLKCMLIIGNNRQSYTDCYSLLRAHIIFVRALFLSKNFTPKSFIFFFPLIAIIRMVTKTI